jgi:glycerol-3-phosphate O-acyltransferase
MSKRTVEYYRSSMVKSFGFFYWISGLWIVFRRLKLSEQSAQRIRDAAEKGTVVYAMRSRSQVDYFALNRELARNDLPLSGFCTGVSTLSIRPIFQVIGLQIRRFFRFLKHGRMEHPVTSGWLSEHVAEGNHATVFLRAPAEWRDLWRPPHWPDPINAVLEAQAKSKKPIQILPVVVVWVHSPEKARKSQPIRALLGTEEEPGFFVKIFGVALGRRNAVVQVGNPVDVQEYLERMVEETPRHRAKALRLLLRRWCFREAQVIRGPRKKSHRWMRHLVLRSRPVREVIAEEAKATGESEAKVYRDMKRKYDKMSARFSTLYLGIARRLVGLVLHSLYKEIDIREEDLERIRQAQREGVAVLVPCHRSHLDYLLMSYLMTKNDIMPPHVVAGDNLSFFPMGSFLRRCGGFFIPRKFTDKRFTVLFQAYVTQLFREGYSVEFFIEGGRSRTGKMLPAKLGVLGNCVDAGVASRVGRSLAEVSWMPIYFTYERVAEERPYARELSGASKKKESIGEVVKASRILFQRHGRVSVRVGEPVRLSTFLESLPAEWAALNRDQRKEALQRLGEELLFRIGQEATVQPSGLLALGMLAQTDPVMTADQLEERIECFHAFLLRRGTIPEEETVVNYGPLKEAMARFIQSNKVIRSETPEGSVFEVNPSRRLTLEYYKNGIAHWFVPASLLARAIQVRGDEPFAPADLTRDLRLQLYLLRYEFSLDPKLDEESIERRALAHLEAAGAVAPLTDGSWMVLDETKLSGFAGITTNFLESANLTLQGLKALASRRLNEKALAKEIQKWGQKRLGESSLMRPESLNLINIQNALKGFREDGTFSVRADGSGLELFHSGWAEYETKLERLLGCADE